MISSEQNMRKSVIISKSNHYVIKNGKVTVRQQKPEPSINYRWIPSSEINKPTTEDYYKQTVKRLENQLKQLMETLKRKEQEWSNKFYQQNKNEHQFYNLNNNADQIKRDYQYQLQAVSEKLKQKQQEYWQREVQVRKQYDLKLQNCNQQLKRKDKILISQEQKIRASKLQFEQKLRNISGQMSEKEQTINLKNTEIQTLKSELELKKNSQRQILEKERLINSKNTEISLLKKQLEEKQKAVNQSFDKQRMSDSRILQQTNISEQKIKNITEQLLHRELQLSLRDEQLKKERDSHHKELQQVFKQLREAQLSIGLKDNEIRMKQTELKEKDLQISSRAEEIEKKDKLIEYQLGVVDRLIHQIEEKQKQQEMMQEQQYENPEQETEQYPYQVHSEERGSEFRSMVNSEVSQNPKSSGVQQRVIQSDIIEEDQNIVRKPQSFSSSRVKYDEVAPLSLDNNSKIKSQSQIKYFSPEKQPLKTSPSEQIFDNDISSIGDQKSRDSEGVLSQNLKTWSQWASNSEPLFFADIINDQDKNLKVKDNQKTSEDEVDPAAGSLSGILGKFTNYI